MFQTTSLFDAYGLRARLLPTLLVVLPATIVVAILLPSIYTTLARIFGSLGVVAVGLFFLAHVIRARGRQLEKRLYVEWGGIPTTAWLRHRDDNLDSRTKARYHKFLGDRISGLQMPTSEQERKDPIEADQTYASAVKWLLEFTRDTKQFPLVFNENVYYGFRRNTLAAKPIALGLLLALIALATWITYRHYGLSIDGIGPDAVAVWLVLIACTALWMLLVTKEWVKDGAYAYARALLASCERIST